MEYGTNTNISNEEEVADQEEERSDDENYWGNKVQTQQMCANGLVGDEDWDEGDEEYAEDEEEQLDAFVVEAEANIRELANLARCSKTSSTQRTLEEWEEDEDDSEDDDSGSDYEVTQP
jgi:hypothetical protein